MFREKRWFGGSSALNADRWSKRNPRIQIVLGSKLLVEVNWFEVA
jgi:hypothetical protein